MCPLHKRNISAPSRIPKIFRSSALQMSDTSSRTLVICTICWQHVDFGIRTLAVHRHSLRRPECRWRCRRWVEFPQAGVFVTPHNTLSYYHLSILQWEWVVPESCCARVHSAITPQETPNEAQIYHMWISIEKTTFVKYVGHHYRPTHHSVEVKKIEAIHSPNPISSHLPFQGRKCSMNTKVQRHTACYLGRWTERAMKL